MKKYLIALYSLLFFTGCNPVTGPDVVTSPSNNFCPTGSSCNSSSSGAGGACTANASGPQITSITRSGGTINGGQSIIIRGTNFSAGNITVTIDGNACAITHEYHDKFIICTTPAAGASGAVDVVVEDTVQNYCATESSGFTYYTDGTASGNICDDFANDGDESDDYPGASLGTSTSYADGDGSSGDPFVICNLNQLASMANNVNSYISGGGKYFKLGANIDMDGIDALTSGGTFKGIPTVTGYFRFREFDGDNHFIYDTSMSTGSTGDVGFFKKGTLWSNNIDIKNFNFLNFTFNGTGTYSGGLISRIYQVNSGTTFSVNNINFYGTITQTCGSQCGMLIGRLAESTINDIDNITIEAESGSSLTVPTSKSSIGGLIGNTWTAGAVTIDNVKISGLDISASGSVYSVGGLIGSSNGSGSVTVNKVSINANISANQEIGGIIGRLDAGNTNALNDIIFRGTLTAASTTPKIGGVVGWSAGNSDCTSTMTDALIIGDIVETSGNAQTGALVGLDENCGTNAGMTFTDVFYDNEYGTVDSTCEVEGVDPDEACAGDYAGATGVGTATLQADGNAGGETFQNWSGATWTFSAGSYPTLN